MTQTLYDMAIVGGGITGLAIARALALSGQKIVLLEKSKLGQATSASSHRIIHGGFRYLAKLDFRRVYESVHNLRSCLTEFSEYVEPLACFMPINRFGIKSKLPLQCAILMYEALRFNDRSLFEKASIVKAVDGPSLIVADNYLRWTDGWLKNHDGLVRALEGDILNNSGCIYENFEVLNIDRVEGFYRVSRANGGSDIGARVVITALGPWAVAGNLATYDNVDLAIAFNVVVNRRLPSFDRFGLVYGVAAESPEGRMYFLSPREDGVAIGTGYLPFQPGSIIPDLPSEEVVRNFLQHSSGLFNWNTISPDEVVRLEYGVIPVRKATLNSVSFFGSTIVQVTEEQGRIDVLSTKYTSFLSTAEQVKKIALKFGR
jgi:glycerol-3-phosphate dehydrogenase